MLLVRAALRCNASADRPDTCKPSSRPCQPSLPKGPGSRREQAVVAAFELSVRDHRNLLLKKGLRLSTKAVDPGMLIVAGSRPVKLDPPPTRDFWLSLTGRSNRRYTTSLQLFASLPKSVRRKPFELVTAVTVKQLPIRSSLSERTDGTRIENRF